MTTMVVSFGLHILHAIELTTLKYFSVHLTSYYSSIYSNVANKLKRGEVPVPELFEDASVYFSDIYGFNELMKDSQPMEIVEMLNDFFRAYDAVIETFKVYKVSILTSAFIAPISLLIILSQLICLS